MTRLQVFLLGCLILSLLVPAAFTQRRGGPGGGPGGPGRGGPGGGFSSDDFFNRMSGGENSFDVNKVELRARGPGDSVEQQREKMMTFLQTKGVTNGIMTRDLYKEYFEKRSAERTKEWAAKGFETLAKGADSFNVDTVEITGMMLMQAPADRHREQMKKFLQSKGISTGV